VDAADSMAMLLEMLGHTVSVAYHGLEALEKAAAERPDVVLLDIGLPELDGYEVCRRLRRGAREPALIVAMTGYGQEGDKLRTQAAGFDAHMVKPVNTEALQDLLRARFSAGAPPQPSRGGVGTRS
jgi:CheY-like chemotaxis protein